MALGSQAIDTIYLEQLSLYGSAIRYSRDLIKTQSAEKALELTGRYLGGLSLSGYLRFLVGDARRPTTFGNKISRHFVHEICAIKPHLASDEKICIAEDFVIIKSRMSFIFLCRKELDAQRLDKLQDILAVLLDTIDAWLDNYMLRKEISLVLQNSLSDLISSSSELLNQHRSASDDLLSSMIVRFPILGLQADQENMILDILNVAAEKHIELIEKQIKKNNSLGDILISSVDMLNNADEYFDSPPEDDSGIELF